MVHSKRADGWYIREVATITLIPKPLLVKKHLRQIKPGGKRRCLLRIIQGDASTLTLTFGEPKLAKASSELFLALGGLAPPLDNPPRWR